MNIPTVAADGVGAYVQTLDRFDFRDDLTSLAPPFDRFFVEVQGVKNRPLDLHAWGLLIEQTESEPPGSSRAGWDLSIHLIIERDKNSPVGPVLTLRVLLDGEGNLIFDVKEPGTFVGVLLPPNMTAEVPDLARLMERMAPYYFTGLLAVSFMHCRNVESETIDPPTKLSRAWKKKRGLPLTRYEVLQIDPMRRLLDSQGEAQSKGLGHALHVCRGHFKTFTEEAPLFGRVTGTFWWADQVRGAKDRGVVHKDYAIKVGGGGTELGDDYRTADETIELSQPEHSGPSPDVAGRGLAAHNRTQNLLAAAIERTGLKPRSPSPDEPRYDLAWTAEGRLYVAEIKSITEKNEERQLRLGLGQVVRYRHQLGGQDRVQAVIALEREPFDGSWLDLCNEQGVILCWPETMDLLVASLGGGGLG